MVVEYNIARDSGDTVRGFKIPLHPSRRRFKRDDADAVENPSSSFMEIIVLSTQLLLLQDGSSR